MTTRLSAQDTEAWASFAAAALTASVPNSKSPEQAVAVAAEVADMMLEALQARRKAHSDYISS